MKPLTDAEYAEFERRKAAGFIFSAEDWIATAGYLLNSDQTRAYINILAWAWMSERLEDFNLEKDGVVWSGLRSTSPQRWEEIKGKVIELFETVGRPMLQRQWHKQTRYYLPKGLRDDVLSDGAVCVKCGTDKNLTVDHKHPRSRGGATKKGNLQPLCRSCNSRKGNRIAA